MIKSVQKVIKIGSSWGVTLPAKEMRRQNIKFGDEVEVIVRPVSQSVSKSDKDVLRTARKILMDYKQDFKNLASR